MTFSPYALPPLVDAGTVAATGQKQRPALLRSACSQKAPTSFRELAALMDKRETKKMLATRKLKKSRSEPALLPKIAQPHLESSQENLLEVFLLPAATDHSSGLATNVGAAAAPESAEEAVQDEEGGYAACTEADVLEDSLKTEEQEDDELPKGSATAKRMWGTVKSKTQLLGIASAFSQAGQRNGAEMEMLDTMQQWRRWCNKTDRGFKSPRSQYPAWKDPDFLGKEIQDLELSLRRDRVRMRKQMEQHVHKSKEGLKITAQHLPAVAGDLNAEVVSRYRKDALESIDIQGKRIREALRDSTLRRKELEVCVQTMKTTFGRQAGEVGFSNADSFLGTLAEARTLNREAQKRSKLLDNLGRDCWDS